MLLGVRIFLILAIFTSMLYGRDLMNERLDVRECMSNAERYDGAYIDYFIEVEIKELRRDGFIGEERGTQIHFLTSGNNFKVGDRVEVGGIFHKNGSIEVLKYRVYVDEIRDIKVFVSVVAAVLALIYFFSAFKNDFAFLRTFDNA